MLESCTWSLQVIPEAEALLKELQAKGQGPFKLKHYKGTFHGFVIRWVAHMVHLKRWRVRL